VFRLIWLLGWLRPRTAMRRVAMMTLAASLLGAGGIGALTGGFASIGDSVGAITGAAGRVGDAIDSLAGGAAASGRRARVTHVVDGDTVDIAFGGSDETVRVRLIGLDTPESKRPGTPVECGAREATHHMLRLTFTAPRDTDGDGLYDTDGGRGRRVTFTTDPTQDRTDRYGRSLGHVRLRGQDRTLQERQLAAGWAVVYVYANRRFAGFDDFVRAARSAKRARRGIYAGCGGDAHRPA
jgi:micrococcal nuclease